MNAPVFLPYQQRWILDRSPVKVCEKSRRIGVTWCTAYEAVEVCSTRAEDGGSNFWYQTYAEDDAKEFIEDVGKFAMALDLAISPQEEIIGEDEAREFFLLPEGVRSIKITSVRFSTGFKCVSLPHLPRKLRGKGGVYCLDEAAFHDNLEEALKAAHAFRMWGGRVIIISTHNGVENAFNKLVEDVRAKRRDYSLHTYTLLDAVRMGLFKRICQVRKTEWSAEAEAKWVEELLDTEGAEEEFLCIPARSGGQYFPPMLTEACMFDAPVLRLKMEDEFMMRPESEREEEIEAWCIANLDPLIARLPRMPHYFGMDFGRNSDLTVMTPTTLEQDLKARVPFTVELRNVPFEQQKQIVFHTLPKLPRFTFAAFDATGNGAWLGEVALQHFGEAQVEAVKLNDPWYAQWLPPLKARFEDRSIAIPKDVDIRQDLSMFEVINGVPKLPKLRVTSASGKKPGARKGEKRHGDTGIALALANYSAATHAVSSYVYEPVGKSREEGISPRADRDSKRSGHFSMKGLW